MTAETTWQAPAISALDPAVAAAIRAGIDGKAKPRGSLGRIEDLSTQLGMIAHPSSAKFERAVLLVFAGDHGITEEGVSQYPSTVTAAMVATYLAGRASANAFAAAANVGIRVVDAGVAAELPAHPGLIRRKIRPGTANSARQPAMSDREVSVALTTGHDIAVAEIDAGNDILALGEMGIGNSASSALLAHRLAPAPLDDCIGMGAGQNEPGMARKRAAIHKAANRSDAQAPIDVMREFGGLEIAMMAGAVLGAASRRRPVIIDGFICSVAALAAVRLAPAARDYCIFAHRSAEKGHQAVLASLEAQPLLDLGMRLGEGTGALLAVPLVRAASRLLSDVADLEDVLAGRL
ncbi:nicotinate-nucleotide--dimethylbenzimidazole phosphoribosyltransferase [Bradyrhizobium lablabi]|uniref:nicotinate-nucleotide--dimethylbenzimidazole phosphoribosyltransferase n=1 Tax=Bradyrhizobium lablabi TaxID=722472 RepID=UPI001BAC407F|nr:nicotinate-nucleotide--dimethylbenzimidazole phosphoribosyltransferase [Bradyrhizobium lablabi]MBR0698167.1 nicotinate-nucleotide--dimethylbenzimidazole phosphoribosyltransferase [Bradyrhizobium lablabi]